MPIYEYKHPETGETRQELRPLSEYKEDFIDENGVVWKKVLSPTPTTFRFNDFTGYGGLEKRRPGH